MTPLGAPAPSTQKPIPAGLGERLAALATDLALLLVAVLVVVHGANAALAPFGAAPFDAFWWRTAPIASQSETADRDQERMQDGSLREATYRRESRIWADGGVRVYAVIEGRFTAPDGSVSTSYVETQIGRNATALVRLRLTQALLVLVPFAYFAALEGSSRQATLGKLALGLRVADLEGKPLGRLHALARQFAKCIDVLTFGFGLMLVLVTDRRQALHDILARTLVVRGRALMGRRALKGHNT